MIRQFVLRKAERKYPAAQRERNSFALDTEFRCVNYQTENRKLYEATQPLGLCRPDKVDPNPLFNL
jgi:hypothetical protein